MLRKFEQELNVYPVIKEQNKEFVAACVLLMVFG